MKSNEVRIDFRKNDKSQKGRDTLGFRFNQQKLFEGEVTIFQTKKSGDFWHMRMYITEHQKYFTKSLRTKSKDSAIEKAKIRLKVEKLRQSFFLQMSQDQQLKGDSQSY